jgi:hypothetical protein
MRDSDVPISREIACALDEMWKQYQPYADAGFKEYFARDPDGRFWEMYLAANLLGAGKELLPRDKHPGGKEGYGPDICILEDGKTIWIEAVAPDEGALSNPDRVPKIVPINQGGKVEKVPKRQLQLRISSAITAKRDAFEQYTKDGLVRDEDAKVIAVSGCRLGLRATTGGLPLPAFVLYPLGDEYIAFDSESMEVVDSGYRLSEQIERTDKSAVPRIAFQHSYFAQITGLIWSTDLIGNFTHSAKGLVYFHNPLSKTKLVQKWAGWSQEFIVVDGENTSELKEV